MDLVLEILGDILVPFIFKYPGALIRWMIFRKKPLGDYCKDGFSNVVVTLFIFTILGFAGYQSHGGAPVQPGSSVQRSF